LNKSDFLTKSMIKKAHEILVNDNLSESTVASPNFSNCPRPDGSITRLGMLKA
jgi:hypothetical protein